VGVKTRRLRLQVTEGDGLVMQHLWQEKDMAAVIIPLKISGDAWATFLPDHPADHLPVGPDVVVASIGDCSDLSGTYSLDGGSVRLDGSVDRRTASDQFFRPEIMGDAAEAADVPEPLSLQVAHSIDGGSELRLLLSDGGHRDRFLKADTVTCETGHWVARGKKEMLSAFMLLTGSVGASSEDLRLSRDHEGALMVRGTYQAGGLLFLIPTGTTTDELFMRFPLLAAE